MPQNGKSDASDGSSAIGKINLRILPFLFFVIFAAFVDRTNVSYAALPMSSHLGLTASMFGFGAGIFFLGEALFSVPSTMAARRAGVHKWIPLLMVGWGICASAMASVTGPVAFYALRFLLGVAEAGVMPSMILAASLWWPESHRARVITGITSGTGVAMVVGAPLAAVLTEIDGALDLAGWRWLFLLEGLPVIAVGLVALLVFPANPQSARWLNQSEKDWLARQMQGDAARRSEPGDDAPLPLSSHLDLLLVAALLNFSAAGAIATLGFWLPLIGQQSLGYSLGDVGRLLAPLYFVGIGLAYIVSHVSDRRQSRYPIVAGCSVGTAAIIAVSTSLGTTVTAFVLLVIASLVARCMGGVFMAAISEDMTGRIAGRGLGIVMISAAIGMFCGNWVFGVLRDVSDGFGAGLGALMVLMTVACLCALYLERRRARSQKWHFRPPDVD